jgi:hypothetical protein
MSLESKAKKISQLIKEAQDDNSSVCLFDRVVPLKEVQELEANFKLMETETLKQLHKICRQLTEAREYADNALVEHNVSYEFIENYGKKLDPEHTEEWVSTAYLKELRAILSVGGK